MVGEIQLFFNGYVVLSETHPRRAKMARLLPPERRTESLAEKDLLRPPVVPFDQLFGGGSPKIDVLKKCPIYWR